MQGQRVNPCISGKNAGCCEGVSEMTREGAEIVKGALRTIFEQCGRTDLCENCPLYDCCQGTDDLFKCRPDHWFRE